ncbi:MAG: hypothetical protein MK137_03390, partial [Rickettsiales bacterium]|nr:hypothetical protein [Rickettsiales bacterium]
TQRSNKITVIMMIAIALSIFIVGTRLSIFVIHTFLLEEIDHSFLIIRDMKSSIVESEEYMSGHWENYLFTYLLNLFLLVCCSLMIMDLALDRAPFMFTQYEAIVIDGITSFDIRKFIQALLHMSQAVFTFLFFVINFIIGSMIALAFVYYVHAIELYEAYEAEAEAANNQYQLIAREIMGVLQGHLAKPQ